MEMEVTRAGDAIVVSMSGHLTPESETDIERQLRKQIARGNHRIVVNMESVSAISSQGLSVLINIRKRAQEAGGDLKLAALRSSIRELFELSRLHAVFDIFENSEKALASF